MAVPQCRPGHRWRRHDAGCGSNDGRRLKIRADARAAKCPRQRAWCPDRVAARLEREAARGRDGSEESRMERMASRRSVLAAAACGGLAALGMALLPAQGLAQGQSVKIGELNSYSRMAAFALISLAASVALIVVLLALGRLADHVGSVVFLVAFGWLSGLGLAQLYKIVAFLTWLECYGPVLGKMPTPRVQDLVVEARASVRYPDADVPPELEAICVKATALREERIPGARELHAEIERFLDGDRDGQIIERAKTLPTIPERMVRAARHVTRRPKRERPLQRHERASDRSLRPSNQRLAPRKPKAADRSGCARACKGSTRPRR